MLPIGVGRRCCAVLLPCAALLVCCGVLLAQAQPPTRQAAPQPRVTPLVLHQTRYRLRAGESVLLDAPVETVDFLARAKSRQVEIDGKEVKGIVLGPNRDGDQILLAASLRMKPGEYTVALSAVSAGGEERTVTLGVTVDQLPAAASNSSAPPVVLLDGWQPPGSTPCPPYTDSAQTFGNLQSYLLSPPASGGYSVPVVYFFENCVECPNCAIEELGSDLGEFLNSLSVPQVDVIAHSMGGLIVRSYLSGAQTSGAFSPPLAPKIRKAIFVATPNFGAMAADFFLADILFFAGTQTNELKPGSQFVWNLGTWNQFGDDLRGTDSVALIGNAGPSGSDGVVDTTSASLDFTLQGNTRVVSYCHIPPSSFGGIGGLYLNCQAPGIADVEDPSHPLYEIADLFLAGSSGWQSVGVSPAQDAYLSEYGGIIVADITALDQYIVPNSVSWGNVNLNKGGASELYYNDFVAGTGIFNFGSSTCGPWSETPGIYSAVRCKVSPAIYSIGPLLPGTARLVQAGTTITVNGSGFGAQCSSCLVTASNPGSTALRISSWSNTTIQAFLPASFAGVSTIGVTTANGFDSINIMAAPASAIAATPSSLQFAYTVGGAVPQAQSVQITNSHGGTLNWSATTGTPWLSVSPASGTAPSTVSLAVSPVGLNAGTYTGAVQISASGASNTPLSVGVTLTVAPAPAPPVLAVSPQALAFTSTVGGANPPAQNVMISNTGAGTLTWSASSTTPWIGLSAVAGTAPATLSISVGPAGLSAGTYSASVQIAAAGATGSPVTVGITLKVQAAQSTVSITSVVNGGSFQPGFASATWIAIFGTNLSQTTRSWQASDFVNGALPTALDGVSVTVNGLPAYVFYISPTQVNVLAPDDSTLGPVAVHVSTGQGKSNTLTAQKQQFAPAFFTLGGGAYVAALHADYSIVGKPGLIAGVTTKPAKPGETILLYGTGFGPTNPPLPSALLVTTPAALANSVQVTMGGQAAPVAYAGLTAAGLYQLNVTVPNLPDGDSPVLARVGGVQSQVGVLLTVQH
jgi:uncharacterized protein (TIGR03437 family)